MKFDYVESKWGLSINLFPESPAEMAQLARAALNAKAEKPLIYLTFSTDSPYLSVNIDKVSESKQSNSINPSDR